MAYLVMHRDTPVPRRPHGRVLAAGLPEAARNSLHVALTGYGGCCAGATPYPLLERRFDTYQLVLSRAPGSMSPSSSTFPPRPRKASDRDGDHGAARRAYEMAADLYEVTSLPTVRTARGQVRVRETDCGLPVDRTARRRLVDLYLDAGDLVSATSTARAALAPRPVQRGASSATHDLLRRPGQIHRALAQYHQCRGLLCHKDALQVRPTAETTRVFDELRAPAIVGVTRRASGTVRHHERRSPPPRLVPSGRVAL